MTEGVLDQIVIDHTSQQPLHSQLHDRIQSAITSGRLPAGARLPSTRSLAVQLGVARGTVEGVYARLVTEGFLISAGSRGTLVAPGLRAQPATVANKTGDPTAPQLKRETWYPLQLGIPAFDLFPRKTWARILASEARQVSTKAMICPDAAGLLSLREEIAAYLNVSRGISCSAEQIVITHGYQDALNLVIDLVLRTGGKVWIEEPGYGYAQRAMLARGVTLVPVPVDDEGFQVEWAIDHAPAPSLAVVTPAHQFPLGMTMSPARRRRLLDRASQARFWILEDDYDCEFHYTGRKPSALKALDVAERVFYVGSFSKVLLPGLRLGYLVLPNSFATEAVENLALRHRGVGIIEQAAVAEFMHQSHFARHLRRMRLHYRSRHNALASALKSEMLNDIDIALRNGGLHILARFSALKDDTEFAQRALAIGLKPSPLSRQYLGSVAKHGLLMSFTNITEDTAQPVAAALARLYRSVILGGPDN